MLQICRSLRRTALPLDTRGHTETLPILGSSSPPKISINVLDAIIEAESVLVVAAFFYGVSVGCSRSDFILNTWDGRAMVWFLNMKLCREFWEDVRDSVCEAHG